jgi:hypothetical protein
MGITTRLKAHARSFIRNHFVGPVELGFRQSIAPLSTSIREDILLLTGQIASKATPTAVSSLQSAEFRVFSQYGEDGIIQFLIKAIKPIKGSFIEFGVQNYTESNTRFLMMNNAWRGLVIDQEPAYIDCIKSQDIMWKFNVAVRQDEVTAENINDIFLQEGFEGEIGLLSIDVDGVDFHLWEAVCVVQPAIVIIEYNRDFPVDRPITVPYEPHFDRTAKHSSNLYFGCSLSALVHLAASKTYQFVGIESHQANAFFVRADLAENLPSDVVRDEYQRPGARERLRAISGMPVVNVVSGTLETI